MGRCPLGELEAYGIDLDTLRHMYEQWCEGVNKSELERTYLKRPQSHGKLFTSLVRTHLGHETERTSKLALERDAPRNEVERLRALLRQHKIDPGTGRPIE